MLARLVAWRFAFGDLLAGRHGGIKSASRDGPGTSDVRGIPAWPPPASKEAGCVSISGCSNPPMLPVRPDSKEGMRTGVITSNPLVSESGS